MRALSIVLTTLSLVAQDERRWPAGSPQQGLPRDAAAFRPYADDAAHPWNEIFRLAWLRECMPDEVALVVDVATGKPGSDPFAARWMLRKRDGVERDRRLFGGDGRQLPIEDFGEEEAKRLRGLLAQVAAEGAAPGTPTAMVVLFQHDLLRIAQRLHDTSARPELLPPLLAAARKLALSRAELTKLADPLAAALAADAVDDLRDGLPTAIGGRRADLHEVLRKSTRLFDAGRTLLWSRVWLAHPDGAAALAKLLPDAEGDATRGPTVPIGMRAVLVQGIVALADDGTFCATPLIVDLRTQVLSNRDPAGKGNATFTRDGLDFAMLQLERQGLRSGEPARFFRRIDPDDQELFRDYGTLKHTTYRAQCALCHRLTDTPEPQLAGFVVLRPHAGAALATTGDERLRLAEQQAAAWLAELTRRD